MPPEAPPPLLANFLGAYRSELMAATLTKKKVYPNISKEEEKALEELKIAQKNGEIVIKEADKGGAFV